MTSGGNGLAMNACAPSAGGALPLALRRAGGEHDERRVPVVLVLADEANQLQSILFQKLAAGGLLAWLVGVGAAELRDGKPWAARQRASG